MKYSDEEIDNALNKHIAKKRKKAIHIGLGVIIVLFVSLMITISIIDKNQNKQDTQAEDIATDTDVVMTATATDVATFTDVVEVAEVQEEIDVLEELGIEIPEKEIDFQQLHIDNPDIYAWIYVPGTLVDYPVLQHPTDNSFYLEHNIDGSAGYPGCIYTELYNKKDFSDRNTLMYGHNMANGTMFATLHYYENSQNFEENQYIFIYTEEKVFVYHIFAAYEYPGIHLMKHYDYTDDKVYEDYLKDVFSGDYYGFIREGVEVTTENKILTLSTCAAGKPDMRYLVQGVLLNDE